MTHFIDRVLEPAVWFLADWSLRWAVVIAVLAAALTPLRPRRASVRYQMYLLVLLAGLLLPALPRWGTGWPTRAAPAEPPAKAGTQPPRVEENTQLAHQKEAEPPAVASTPGRAPSGRAPRAAPPHADVPPAAPGSPEPAGQVAESLGTRRVVFLGLSLGWAFGVLVLLVRWASGWLLLGRLRRTATNIEGPSAQLFAACRTALGLRRSATLAMHPAIRSPITFGLRRPIVVVPPGWPELPDPVRRGTLLHELAHLARGDDWWAVLLELVRTVFFFHPFVWWLLNRIERERELLCDEAAVARGVDPHDYAQMLLEFARRPGRLTPAGFVGLLYPLRFGRRRTVKARIHHLLEDHMERWLSPLPAWRMVALGCVILGLALGLGSLRVRALPPKTLGVLPEPTKQLPSLLESRRPATAPTESKRPPDSRQKTDSANALYRIKPYDVLQIQATATLPGAPIKGSYLVEADGRVDLGPGYGKVSLDQGIVNGKAREVTLSRFAPVARVKIRP
jgi:beta-lactamase regulating signal transducer with metallopeptidase domain